MGRQSIRISQMILTLGPGAILESREGPRILLRNGLQLPPDISLNDLKLFSPELENLLPRMLGIRDDTPVRIFQVPGSGAVENARWRTKPFPEWHLCVSHQILYRKECPECEKAGDRFRGSRRREAIRFVLACPAGHLDDVDWHRLVHGGNPPHRPEYYYWKSGGTGLSDIRIVCPVCNRGRSLGEAYGESWPCSGRFPEREEPGHTPSRSGCQMGAYILQRQASNLRVPETVSLFTVPPLFTRTHQVIQKLAQQITPDMLKGLLIVNGSLQREFLEPMLNQLVRQKVLRVSEKDEFLRASDGEIVRALCDVLDYRPPSELAVLLCQEFRAFLKGAREGIPPIRDPAFSSRVLLEVNPGLVRSHPPFLVVPVSRLRLVTVQIGYRRNVGPVLEQDREPDLVDISIRDSNGTCWFPGYESTGEGLFITLDTGGDGWIKPPPEVVSPESSRWMKAYRQPDLYDGMLFRDPEQRVELHPCFVAWHTFSHLLIRALSVDSGYSAPSIRERVYLEEAPDGRVRGGVLIYTTSRGSDGSLGGLLVLANTFDRILERVREMAHFCSADPLCREHNFEPGKAVSGAACHACCLISETSCEHRNHWLDRAVLLEMGWL